MPPSLSTAPGTKLAVTPVIHFDRNTQGRDFACGDTHGCFSVLMRSLEYIGFDIGKDRLFLTGDLVDRGSESMEMVELLGESWVASCVGNHDVMAWLSVMGQAFNGVNHQAHGGAWVQSLTPPQRALVARRLSALPGALVVETGAGPVAIVHADYPEQDWQRFGCIDWSYMNQLHGLAAQCLWSPRRLTNGWNEPVKNVRAIVHGHATLEMPKALGNVFYIDTGGWMPTGRFAFLELETFKFHFGPLAHSVAPPITSLNTALHRKLDQEGGAKPSTYHSAMRALPRVASKTRTDRGA
ncbi:hypothetical protein RD110_01175 [Rhodoferax koreense]|uniref:Calcineurin-like phosphoesterase domain-containing protein n=1 Tax=Rhodoferax koreensis TaxID=1842727 RepID=A0A1P8JQH1_9BURK|nr:metallophosphoesterase [Rhodoferax koreense]APW35990.1 hypothetical protein RD110_01175 [Rhodoferax koreense]